MSTPIENPRAVIEHAGVMLQAGSRKAIALRIMASEPGVRLQRLVSMTGTNHRGQLGRFMADVLTPMQHAGLARSVEDDQGSCWWATYTGLQMVHCMHPSAEPFADPRVARPREVMSTQPMPRGEFRIPRAGAYDYEQCPSRYGNELHYRDGRVEYLNP